MSYLTLDDRDAAVVSASHGGTSAAEYALRVRPAVIAFNDAGGGKDGAGYRALALLDPPGVGAVTVSHDSAQIGDAGDAWRSGIVSRVNAVAAAAGAEPGQPLRVAFARLLGSAATRTGALPAGAVGYREDGGARGPGDPDGGTAVLSREQMDQLSGGTVHGPSGERIGQVDRLFLNDRTGVPQWVTVRAEAGAREVFVPLAAARPHPGGLAVPYDIATVAGAPQVGTQAGHLTPQEEAELFRYYGVPVDSGPPPGAEGAGMVRAEERLRVGSRTVVAGRARLRKYVLTEMQQIEVPVRREEVRLEWEPAADLQPTDAVVGDRIAERERELILFAERPVVTTETVAVERVRLAIDVVAGTETVTGEIRKEQVQVDRRP